MHRHRNDPEELRLLLPPFSDGPFVVKRGRGMDTEVYAGLAREITIPKPARQTVIIACQTLCTRRIGCDTAFFPVERWEPAPIPPAGLIFDYLWFYAHEKRERLKLVAAHHDRCWLCSYTNPVQRELFSHTLTKMFLEECGQNEPLVKRIRDWLLCAL